MRTFRTLLACALLHCIFFSGTVIAEKPHEYSFGVVPQFEQRKLYAIWKPIIDELEKETGFSFKLVTTLKINDFEKEYQAGKFDFCYMNPYFVIKGVTPGTYVPLVRDKKDLRGIIVVRRDGPVKNISDLKNQTVAFPAPNALGATLLTKSELKRLFGVNVIPLYVKTHSSVYINVATGIAKAGGGVEKTFQQQNARLRDMLAILHTTQSFPSHPVSAHQRIPAEVREKVKRAFLDMNNSAAGKALLSKIPAKEMIPASLDDYLVMEPWKLDEFWDPDWTED